MTLILVETKLYRGKSWHATAESSMVELKIISKKVISYNGLNFIQFNLNNLWRKIRSKITSHLVHIIQLQREKLREITMYIESGINEMSCKTDQVLLWSILTDFLLSYRSMLHSMMEYTPVIILILDITEPGSAISEWEEGSRAVEAKLTWRNNLSREEVEIAW